MVSTRGVRYKFSEGERVLCYEPDPTKAKVLYDSKVLEVIENKDKRGRRTVEYLIHFQGWNSSWDRCVGEDFVLKDTEENRQLQRDLAEKSQLQLGAYLYRRERKKGSTSGSASSSAAKRSRLRFSDDGSSSSTQPDEPEIEEAGNGEPEAADAENSQESPEEEIKQEIKQEIKEEIESDSSESSENEPRGRAAAASPADHVQPVGRANLTIPAVLRDRLTFDYHLIVKRNRLTRLPASPCAAQILESFVKWFARAGAWNTPRCRNEPPQKPDLADVSRRLNLVREVADGMRVYFDFIMRGNLLYKPELAQYHQVCGQFLDQQERKMKEELESDGLSQDEYEDDNASADEDMKSPKIPEYSHLPPDPIQASNENGIVDVNHIKQEIKEEPEDIEEESEMTEEMDAELQERMQEAMQREMEAGMAQEIQEGMEHEMQEGMEQEMQEEMEQEMQEGIEQEMQEGIEQEMEEGLEQEMEEGLEQEMPEEDMQIKEEIEDNEYYQEDYQETIQDDIQDDLQDDIQDQLQDDIQDQLQDEIPDDLQDYQVEIQEDYHENVNGDIEEVLQVVIHQEIEVEIQLVIREELQEEIDDKQIEEYEDMIPNEKLQFIEEGAQETKEMSEVEEAVLMEIKQEKEDRTTTDDPTLQSAEMECPELKTEQPSDSQSPQTPDEPVVQATENTPSHMTRDPQTSDGHHAREGLRSQTVEANRNGLRSQTFDSHHTREGLRTRSLEGHSIREGLRSQSMEGHHSPRSPLVEDSFANTIRRELHRPNTRSRRGNNSPAVDRGTNSPGIQRGTNSPAIEEFPGSVADDPQSFANTIRQQINRPTTRGQRRRGNNSPATLPVIEEPHSSNTASTMEAPLITEIKQEPEFETHRPATRTRTRSCKSISSPATNSPAINSPAVSSPAVNSPAVSSPAVDSPAVSSPTVNSPAVSSPAANSPAIDSPAVESPAVDSPVVNSSAVESPEATPGGSNAAVEGHALITEIKQEPRDHEVSRPATRSGNVARRLRSRKSAVSQSENEEPQPSTSTAEPRNFEHSSSVGSGSGSSNEEWSKPTEPAPTASSTRTPLSLLLDKVSKYEIIPREGTEHLPCRVYGAIHLARLFVRLPDFLNATQMSDFKLKLVVKHIDMFIQYLVEHKEWFGEKFYYCDSMSRST